MKSYGLLFVAVLALAGAVPAVFGTTPAKSLDVVFEEVFAIIEPPPTPSSAIKETRSR